nr:MerR family transcriptional regulator [Nocardiopsis algeriensis]
MPEDVGYRGPAACTAAGITYRQLDYWARTGLVEPSVRAGAHNAPLYSLPDILLLKVAKRLLDTGISLQQIRTAVDHLRGRPAPELARITLMSDGVSVYECTTPEEVVDLMQRGQGMFGLALANVWRELEEALGVVPAEGRADLPETAPQPVDELARRRRERRTG